MLESKGWPLKPQVAHSKDTSNIMFNGTTPTTTPLSITTADRCVEKLSSVPLTKAQESLLVHGSNFAIAPIYPPHVEYNATVEQACLTLEPKEAELSVEIRGASQVFLHHQSNVTKEKMKALKELQQGKTRVILKADKGVVLLVLDKADYIKKAKNLLKL